MNDEELTKLAEAELLQEAKRGAMRAETLGPEGWKKCAVKPNKKFLQNTLRSALYNNKQRSKKSIVHCDRKCLSIM